MGEPVMPIKSFHRIWIFLLALVLVPPLMANGADSEQPRAFLGGIEAYGQANYQAAIDEFLKLTEAGVRNGRLFYNLGNAYLKNKDLGRAILWYERAKHLIPSDPDLKFNLHYARSLVKDEKGSIESPMVRVIFFWQDILSRNVLQRMALVANAMFWLSLGVMLFRKSRILKSFSILALILTLLVTPTVLFQFYGDWFIRRGIVLPAELSVHAGRNEQATELFNLHAGTKVTIQDEKDGYFRIFYDQGKIGWVEAEKIGVI